MKVIRVRSLVINGITVIGGIEKWGREEGIWWFKMETGGHIYAAGNVMLVEEEVEDGKS